MLPHHQRAIAVGALAAQQGSDADGYIDAALTRLQTAVGAVFDRDVLLLSARSEIGATSMARTELAAGVYPPARTVVQAISGAPQSEIPELQALAAGLPS